MENSDVYKKILHIHDHVMGLMRSMNLPPFPSNYKKYFDQVFSEMADLELKKAMEDEEHRVSGVGHEDITQYIDIAKRSIATFSKSHQELTTIAQTQQKCIEEAPQTMLEEYRDFIEDLSKANRYLTEQLDSSKTMITELTGELNEALTTLATDMLTKVGNRSALFEALKGAIEVGKTKKLPLILMMVDIDNFNYLNHEYGESAGDKVLYFIAQTIKAMIRESDKIYRFGGEEFAVLLARCDQKEAMNIAEKIRQKIEKTNLIYMGKSVHITISIGVTVHNQGDTFESLIERSEKALYCAKKSNKNCTYMFDW